MGGWGWGGGAKGGGMELERGGGVTERFVFCGGREDPLKCSVCMAEQH